MPDDPHRPRPAVDPLLVPAAESGRIVNASQPATPAVDVATIGQNDAAKAQVEAREAILTQFQRDQQPAHADALHPLTPKERAYVQALSEYETRQASEAAREVRFAKAREFDEAWRHRDDWLRQDNQQLAQDRAVIRNDAAHADAVAQDAAALAAQAAADPRYPASFAGRATATLAAERDAALLEAEPQSERARLMAAAMQPAAETRDNQRDADRSRQEAAPQSGYRSFAAGIAAALDAERQDGLRRSAPEPSAERAEMTAAALSTRDEAGASAAPSERGKLMEAAMDREMTDAQAARAAALQRSIGTERNSETAEANMSRARNSTERGRGRE